MKDEGSHDHSDSAYDMLEEYVIGRLGTESTVVRDGTQSKLRFTRKHTHGGFSLQTGKLRMTSTPKTLTRRKILRRHSFWTFVRPYCSKCGMPTLGMVGTSLPKTYFLTAWI
jgi:hypothetical protein